MAKHSMYTLTMLFKSIFFLILLMVVKWTYNEYHLIIYLSIVSYIIYFWLRDVDIELSLVKQWHTFNEL